MKLRRIDHIGIIVEDLPSAKDFFLTLGMEVMCDGDFEGRELDRIIGLQGAKTSMVMMKTPDGGANIELIKFHRPAASEHPSQALPGNVPGLRHLAFAVEGIEALVAKLETKGAELMGEIVNYEDSYKLCFLRGPAGIILELAEELP